MRRILLNFIILYLATGLMAQNKVGIGTDTPDDLLHVKGGDLRLEHSSFPKFKLFQGTTEAGILEFNGLNFWITNKRPGTIHFRTQETSRLSITDAGNVGIGEFDPDDLLHVKGGDFRVEHVSVPKIKLFQGTSQAGALEVDGSDLWLANNMIGNTYFSTQDIARLTVGYNGDVGIGTTVPGDRLHVQDGNIRLYGDNLFVDLYNTHPSLSTGIRFYENTTFRGAQFYSPYTNQLNITRSVGEFGMVVDFNNNHVGIGTDVASQLLHVDGKITIGTDTTTAVAGTMRYSGGTFEGYDGSQWTDFGAGDSHWSEVSNRIYYNDGAVLVGRTNTIDAERFGVRYQVSGANYGGMYIETNGHADSKPFYGYAIDNDGKMWHYYDGASEDWRVYNSGNRFTVESDGDVGVGTTEPDAPLHVAGGNNWDLTNTEGDFKIGNSNYRILMGLATGGGGAGTARIFSKGGASRLILGGDTTDVMTLLPNGRVGIGLNTPLHALHVYRPNASYNVMIESDNGAPDFVLDYDNPGNDNSTITFQNAGAFMGSIGYNPIEEQIFIYESGSALIAKNDRVGISMAPNTSYKLSVENSAVVQSASGAPDLTLDHSIGTSGNSTLTFREEGTFKGSIGYDPDDEYVFIYEGGNVLIGQDGRLGVGIVPNANYKLSVDGKIIGEEVKVQLSQNWPDYVFKEDYRLPSLAELEDHIATQGHLPGVPSAAEINAAEGFEVGEMNRVLLEKVEELTLYILQQDKRLAEQEKRIAQLEAASK